MKKITSLLLVLAMGLFNFAPALAAASTQVKKAGSVKTTGEMKFAFVFDGPSDKNKQVLETFKTEIKKSLQGDLTAKFDDSLVFVGNWTKEGAAQASEKALNSSARMVISLGYMSSSYLERKQDKKKITVTMDEYGLKGMENSIFNPVEQAFSDFALFNRLFPEQKKIAVFINEGFYKTKADWNKIVSERFKAKNINADVVFVPVNANNYQEKITGLASDIDSAFVTPLFNLTTEQRKDLYVQLSAKKLPTFSSIGQEDVKLGALIGTSALNADKKLAEATSFSIQGVIKGNKVQSQKIGYVEDKVIFVNTDTAATIGYVVPLRLLNSAEIISSKEIPTYDLSYILNTLDDKNKDIERQKYLVRAARRSATSAVLRYLPTLRIDLGYQTYNEDYARSYTDVPQRAGQFIIGMDQVIYSPDLVTNIIVKNKKLKFQKAEELLTQQTMGHEVANIYVDVLTLKNAIAIQEEFVKDTRENLAIARVRAQQGFSGKEEVLRWAGELSDCEQRLVNMKAEYSNLQIAINNMLYQNQRTQFNLKPLTADDPAFFTSDMHVIDHVRTPQKLAVFTDELIKYAIDVAPETAKLKAAIAMKKAELSNYAQKFVLPSAKITLEYGSQFDRYLPYVNHPVTGPLTTGSVTQMGMAQGHPVDSVFDKNSGRMFIAAQWKPFEGGTKIAEIARCKAELDELKAYLDEVHFKIETNVRQVVNRALAKYFTIEKNYKSMFAQAENYKIVKAKYAAGKVPIAQVVDAQHLYVSAKLAAINSQNHFFKELLWVQRGLTCVNWTKATPQAKKWVEELKAKLPAEQDFSLEKL